MPEHFHILITPCVSLERAVQFIKGGFSFRVKKELGSSMEIWQVGFSDHRIRDAQDYRKHVEYIRRNPVGRGLAERAEDYAYCSLHSGRAKDEVPQWLKPLEELSGCGAAEAAPFQSNSGQQSKGRAVPLQSNSESNLEEKAESFQSSAGQQGKAAPLQSNSGQQSKGRAVPLQSNSESNLEEKAESFQSSAGQQGKAVPLQSSAPTSIGPGQNRMFIAPSQSNRTGLLEDLPMEKTQTRYNS
jgi:putative transposase